MKLYVSTLRIGIPSIMIALHLFTTTHALRFDRSRVTSYTMRNFEDVVIFVADMEREIERLNALEKKLLAMNVLEEYTIPEVARLLGCTQRTVERFLQDAPDQLSRILLAGGLMEQLPSGGSKTCREGKNYNFDLSDTNQGGDIEKLAVHPL